MDRDDKHLDGKELARVWTKIKARFVALSSVSQTIGGNLYIKNSSNYSQMGVWCDKPSGGAYIEFLNNSNTLGAIGITETGLKYKDVGGNEYNIWSEFNQGANSGMDADKLDGQHGSYYAAKSTMETTVNILAGALGTMQASLGTMAYQDTERYVQKDEFSDTSVTFDNGTTAGPTLQLMVAGLGSASAVIPSASASASGIVTTGAQTFAGAKTFSDAMTLGSTLTISGGIIPSTTNSYSLGASDKRWSYLYTRYFNASDTAIFGDDLVIANNKSILFKDHSSSNNWEVLSLNSDDNLYIGLGVAGMDKDTIIYGSNVKIYTDLLIYSHLTATFDASGNLTIENNITAKGNLVSQNNVTASGNVTAQGGVSALGIADLAINN